MAAEPQLGAGASGAARRLLHPRRPPVVQRIVRRRFHQRHVRQSVVTDVLVDSKRSDGSAGLGHTTTRSPSSAFAWRRARLHRANDAVVRVRRRVQVFQLLFGLELQVRACRRSCPRRARHRRRLPLPSPIWRGSTAPSRRRIGLLRVELRRSPPTRVRHDFQSTLTACAGGLQSALFGKGSSGAHDLNVTLVGDGTRTARHLPGRRPRRRSPFDSLPASSPLDEDKFFDIGPFGPRSATVKFLVGLVHPSWDFGYPRRGTCRLDRLRESPPQVRLTTSRSKPAGITTDFASSTLPRSASVFRKTPKASRKAVLTLRAPSSRADHHRRRGRRPELGRRQRQGAGSAGRRRRSSSQLSRRRPARRLPRPRTAHTTGQIRRRSRRTFARRRATSSR